MCAAPVGTGPEPAAYMVAIVPRGTGGLVSGDVSSAATVVLADNGRPTAGVQLLQAAIAASSSATSGSGGGPIVSLATSGGEPIFPVTPLSYDRNVTAGGMGTYFSNNEDLNGADEPGGLSTSATQVFQSPGNTVYDATGWAAFVPSNNLGIAVTEPLSTTATQPAPAYTGSAVLAFVNVLNNVYSPACNNFPTCSMGSNNNDLYVFSVDSVATLEKDGRAGAASPSINLTGIVDGQGLAADAASNAKVQVRDVTPPFVTEAYRSADGANFVITFDEPVQLQGTIAFTNCGVNLNLANAALDTTNPLAVSGDTVTVPLRGRVKGVGVRLKIKRGRSHLARPRLGTGDSPTEPSLIAR